ncbi:MAG: hypothetical protein JWQ62_1042 [Lacunisphaera sp.]|nr:hypothetical protein [Lacunisphaera sp.]
MKPATKSPVLFFKRIFKFEKAQVAQMEAAKDNRLTTRSTPGSSFPLHAYLSLVRYEWKPSKVINISGTGLNLLTARDARATDGQDAKLKLVLGKYELVLAGRLAHTAVKEKGRLCGIALKFADFTEQKAYLQLLQPIVIGQSLQPLPGDEVVQDQPQFIKQVYRGEGNSELTVWLVKTFGTPFHRFEFQTHDYFCRADVNSNELEIGLRKAADQPVSIPTPALREEIRQLFRWIPHNLSAAVPDDVRAFMQRFTG